MLTVKAAGNFFGHVCVRDPFRHEPNNIIASSELRCACIDRKALVQFAAKNPKATESICAVLSSR